MKTFIQGSKFRYNDENIDIGIKKMTSEKTNNNVFRHGVRK